MVQLQQDHDAVLKLSDRNSFRSKVVQVFGELLRELLVIEDDEARVQPQVLFEGFVNERTLLRSVHCLLLLQSSLCSESQGLIS